MPLLERASGSVRRPSLASLPQPPAGRTGWPWTEQSLRLPERTPTGGAWPRLTIVTPSFNQGRFIEATIRSILLQGYPDLEYFVLDGGSSDGTREIIAKYAPWIDFAISEPDRGQSSAINRGLSMGSGSHATWINSDDMLCQNALFNLFSHHVLADHVIAVGDCVVIDAIRLCSSNSIAAQFTPSEILSVSERCGRPEATCASRRCCSRLLWRFGSAD